MIDAFILIGNDGEDQQLKAVVDGKSYLFHSSHINFRTLVEACASGDSEAFLDNIKGEEFVKNWSCDHIKVVDNELYYGDSLVEPTITDRILSIIEKGLSWDHLAKFLNGVYASTSFRVRNELYRFLENKGMPITPDGCFLAYKGVVKSKTEFVDKCGYKVKVGDNVDKWTRRSHRNNVGDVVYMDRADVNDDAGTACAAGLHAGSEQYADSWGEVGLIVKIDPKDVVCIPTSDAQKLRCCKYTVISEYSNKMDDAYDERYVEDDIVCDDDYDEYSEEFYSDESDSDTNCCGGNSKDCVDGDLGDLGDMTYNPYGY